MIIDINGTILTPGDFGENCLGNGEHLDEKGNLIECCCDECDYMICCNSVENDCSNCFDFYCSKSQTNR